MKTLVLFFIYKTAKTDGVFKTLKSRLPSSKVKQLDKLLSYRCRVAKLNIKLNYYKHCLDAGVYDNGILRDVRRCNLRPSASLCSQFVSNRISHIQDNLISVQDSILRLKDIEFDLPVYLFLRYKRMSIKLVETTRQRFNASSQWKIQRLDDGLSSSHFRPQIIHNFSSHQLSHSEQNALSFGLNFCIPDHKLSKEDIYAEFELTMVQLNEMSPTNPDKIQALKGGLVNIASKVASAKPIFMGVSHEHLEALKNLRQRQELLITKPDKGSGVVLLNKSDYVSKMERILRDTTKFEWCEKQCDSTHKLESDISKCLKECKDDNIISEQLYNKVKPHGSKIPRLYGLPKVHKDDVPLRPILSMCDSAQHLLAKWLVTVLKPIEQSVSRYCVKDSFQFADMMKDYNFKDQIMASFDITSLFTNVPINDTIDMIEEIILKFGIPVSVPFPMLRRLLTLCTKGVQFLFNGKYVKQIDGIAMGSPLGPTLANIFLGYLEMKISGVINKSLSSYMRYVDDIFVVGHRDSVDKVFQSLNSLHPNLSLTCEIEQKNCLAFLDVLVKRDVCGRGTLSVYRKPTWSGVYTHFKSFVPICRKIALVKTLFTRGNRICSPNNLNEEHEFLKRTLMNNGYPLEFIERHSQSNKTDPQFGPKKRIVTLRVPFKGDSFHDHITRKLRHEISSVYSTVDLQVIPLTRPHWYCHLKDSRAPETESKIIYEFKCTCGSRYIGRTERRLSQRMAEHVPRWLLNGKPRRSAEKLSSAITRHLKICIPSKPPRTCFRILRRCRNKAHLCVQEAILIKYAQPDLCTQKETVVNLILPW